MQFLPVIKQSTDAVINITTGGGLGMSLDERLAAPLLAKPEMCSLNMGSMNFNIAPSAARVKSFKHDWEKPYLEGTTNYIFRNTFQDIEQVVERLGVAVEDIEVLDAQHQSYSLDILRLGPAGIWDQHSVRPRQWG